MSDFSSLEAEIIRTGPNLEVTVDDEGVCILIRIILTVIMAVVVQFGVESGQSIGILKPCDTFLLLLVVDVDDTF